MSFKSVMATIVAVLAGALSTVIAILCGKNKELKKVKEESIKKDDIIKKQDNIAVENAKIEENTNEKIESINTGNDDDDFNSCLDILRNNAGSSSE